VSPLAWLLGGELGAAGSLVWAGQGWMIALAAVGASIVFVASFVGARAVQWRIVETIGLLVALVGVVVAVARPSWVEEEGRTEQGRVVVLVDASRSMDVLEGGVKRSAAVQPILDAIDAERVEVLHFGDALRSGAPSEFDLPGTDLEGALDALAERVAGERLAAVVVVSDGIDRSGLRKRFRAEAAPADPRAPGPITVFQVGAAGELVDLGIRSVDSGGFAFLRSPFQIRAEIAGTGRPGVTVPVSLERDGVPITTRTVQLDERGEAIATFDVVPPEAGRFTYTVSVPIWADDAVPGNNALPIVVRVVRDRLRVLQVAGAPSWDVKMLRRFLKEDPSVDLVSFFILRTPRDMDAGWDEDELSLIQFPHEKLFTDELWSFDLVIFQNFDYEPYFSGMGGAFGRDGSRLLDNVAKFVREDGKGFVMIGGPRSFDLGKYDGTAVGDILPVRLGVQGDPVVEPPFKPVLTEAGRRHPITRLVDEDVENSEWWARLHEQDGMNRSLGAVPGAAVLLAHPNEVAPGGLPLPVLAVREVGAGRTMALAVDASWRWSFSEAAAGRGNQAYLRFWKNAMRWLVKDPTTGRVVATTARENYAMGDSVRISVRVRDESFEPVEGAAVAVTVSDGGEVPTVLEGVTTADGEAILEMVAQKQGAHRVSAVARGVAKAIGTSETVFAVTTRDPELDDVIPDPAFLRWLAERGGGRYHPPGTTGPIVRDASAGRTVWDRRETDLSRAPLLAGLVCLGAGVAWMARRRGGLR
jgi:hypothetical protein